MSMTSRGTSATAFGMMVDRFTRHGAYSDPPSSAQRERFLLLSA
jgi:hypothetical protein